MRHAMSSRRLAVRLGVASAAILAGLYSVGMLWRPIPNVVPAVAYLCALVGLRHGDRWGGFGGALFLLATTVGFVSTERRLCGPMSTPGNLASIAILAAIFSILLFFAGRVLRHSAPRSRALWLLVSIAALAFTTTHNPYVVATAAMENTILTGDTLYFRLTGDSYTPARGDIVVFRYPPDPNQLFLKRIAGIPGDRIPLRDASPAIPAAQLGAWAAERAANTSGDDLVVPQEKYFVVGDNRANSLDSRYWGFVGRDAILGTPSFIGFSVDLPAAELAAPQLTSPILFHPSRIRWNRLLRPVR
jgi:signal peptidase I